MSKAQRARETIDARGPLLIPGVFDALIELDAHYELERRALDRRDEG